MGNKLRNSVIALFFGCILALGGFIYKDYGISWDEKVERIDGAVAISYASERMGIEVPGLNEMLQAQNYTNSLELQTYKDRYYPVGFNYPIELIIRILGLNEERDAYLFRHLMTFLISFLGMIALFKLASNRFKDWRYGILAVTFFLISPRFFAESFFNSKDIVLWAFFTIATYTLIRFLVQPNWTNALLHAVATALALNIRLMAVVLVILTFVTLIINVYRSKIISTKAIKFYFVYIAVILIITVFMWPLLWENGLQNFIDAFRFMAKYSFSQDTLYFGKIISSKDLPWHYLPMWIFITTPLALVGLWLVGVGCVLINLYKYHQFFWKSDEEIQDLIFLALFLGPIFGVIVFHSVIYDGWRHLYFIYTGFLLTSIQGAKFLFENLKSKKIQLNIFIGLFALIACSIVFWMVKAHPYQNTYFNKSIGNGWIHKFDVDYWGLSNLSAFKKILAEDSRKKIYIKDGAYNFLPLSLSMLNTEDQNRIFFTSDLKEANYIVTNFRLNQTNYEHLNGCWKHFSSIKINDELISSTYKNVKDGLPVKLTKGAQFSFSKGNEDLCMLGNGWSNPESWGVWADSSQSIIYFPKKILSFKAIEFDMKALVGDRVPFQKISISIDGQAIKDYKLDNFESNKIIYPLTGTEKNLQETEWVALKIRSSNLIKPVDIGLGVDQRKLSIGLISLTIL